MYRLHIVRNSMARSSKLRHKFKQIIISSLSIICFVGLSIRGSLILPRLRGAQGWLLGVVHSHMRILRYSSRLVRILIFGLCGNRRHDISPSAYKYTSFDPPNGRGHTPEQRFFIRILFKYKIFFSFKILLFIFIFRRKSNGFAKLFASS